MPTFPTYDGELPSCLNPWNPRHYLLVLYWVYFRPSMLKVYYYQISRIDTNLKNQINIVRINFLLISLVISQIPALVRLFLSAYECSQDLRCDWNIDFIYLARNLSSFLLGLLSGGVPGAISAGLEWGFFSEFIQENGRMGERLFLSILIGLTTRSIFAIFGGPKTIVLFLHLTSFVWLIPSLYLNKLLIVPVFNISISSFLIVNFLAFILGFLRFPVYCLQSFILLKSIHSSDTCYPIVLDELNVLPIPKLNVYLLNQLLLNEGNGLKQIVLNLGNPFHQWAVRNAIWSYLKLSKSPVENIYKWFTAKELKTLIYVDQVRRHPYVTLGRQVAFIEAGYSAKVVDFPEPVYSARKILFSELSETSHSGRFLKVYNSLLGRYVLNRPILNLKELFKLYVLTEFSQLFYALSVELRSESTIVGDNSLKISLMRLPLDIDEYPYGHEIRKSINTISTYLRFKTPEDIINASQCVGWIAPKLDFLNLGVIRTIQNLASVGQEISHFYTASSRMNRLAALSRARDELQKLTSYVIENVSGDYPEQGQLLRIISQWQQIIIPIGGELGRLVNLQSVENPYVAGNPVSGKLFVGRDDILQRIEELWTQPDQISSIVLYGHRRMGKTSILRNLPGRFGPHTHIIDFNLQRVGMIDQLSDLIYRLAIELHDALPAKLKTHIPEPTEDQYYNTNNPTTQLDRLLKQIQTHRQNDRFIVAIDEFEILEDLILQGKIEPTIIAYLRALIQTYPWFILIFAGLHTLQEMTENYWNPLFGSVTRIPVSTLSRAAARELITNPTDDFPLDYDQDAIDRIIYLSGGQPYLTQLLCQSLITRFNRIRFEERREIEPRFTLQDVETIVANPDFYRDGNAYFSALWDQATETHAPTQHQILHLLTSSPLTLPELTNLIPNTNLIPALQTLLEHDVIALETDRYTYRVELLRLWVTRK